ncbi:MAG: stress response translation initiation inhibitor YciH [Dehalococcoidia bacterium]
MANESNSRLVYSSDGTDRGRVTPPKERAPRRGTAAASDGLPRDPGDGVVRLHRGKSAKGGKTQTLIVGLPGSEAELDAVLTRCKQRIGAGGTRQGRVLLVQGDHREKVRALLEAEGHTVKLAGV